MPVDMLAQRGGVRLTIEDYQDPLVGTAEQLIISTMSSSSTETGFAIEKWTFTFDEGTLELSTTYRDGEGKIVSTEGTGIFARAHFKGAYDVSLTWYGEAGYNVAVGIGEIMFN